MSLKAALPDAFPDFVYHDPHDDIPTPAGSDETEEVPKTAPAEAPENTPSADVSGTEEQNAG